MHRRRRPRPVRLGRDRPRVPPIPRRGVGHARSTIGAPLREGLPRGLPGRAVVDHHPPAAAGVPRGLPRVRRRAGRRDDRGRRRAPPRRRRIIRHRGKIEATIQNARAALDARRPLDELLWELRPGAAADAAARPFAEVPATTPESAAMSKALRRLGFRSSGRRRCTRSCRRRDGRRPPRRLLPGRDGRGARRAGGARPEACDAVPALARARSGDELEFARRPRRPRRSSVDRKPAPRAHSIRSSIDATRGRESSTARVNSALGALVEVVERASPTRRRRPRRPARTRRRAPGAGPSSAYPSERRSRSPRRPTRVRSRSAPRQNASQPDSGKPGVVGEPVRRDRVDRPDQPEQRRVHDHRVPRRTTARRS